MDLPANYKIKKLKRSDGFSGCGIKRVIDDCTGEKYIGKLGLSAEEAANSIRASQMGIGVPVIGLFMYKGKRLLVMEEVEQILDDCVELTGDDLQQFKDLFQSMIYSNLMNVDGSFGKLRGKWYSFDWDVVVDDQNEFLDVYLGECLIDFYPNLNPVLSNNTSYITIRS